MDAADLGIDICHSLILEDLAEAGGNTLRVVVAETIVSPVVEDLQVGTATIKGVRRIEVTRDSRHFELIWRRYIAYCVVNESHQRGDEADEVCDSGRLLRRYSRSRFLDYVAATTWIDADLSGPTLHCCLVCEDHVVHVASSEAPRVSMVRPPPS